MSLLPLDEVHAARGAGGAVRVLQSRDELAAFRLLAVFGMVRGAERADALAVAHGSPVTFGGLQVDEIGIDDNGDLALGAALGVGRGRLVLEDLRFGETRDPAAVAPEDRLAVRQQV